MHIDSLPQLDWDDWYGELQDLAVKHRVSVADQDAWYPEWDAGKSPQDALYADYPELRPEEPCKKQHSTPCRECPFKRDSAPGWLGASEPGEFLALADSDNRAPCHMHVNYDKPDWERQAAVAPQCVGRAVFMANRCKLPAPGLLKAKSNPDAVFVRPHEFVAHHARLDPTSLESTLVWDLYDIKKQPLPGTSAKTATKPSTRRK